MPCPICDSRRVAPAFKVAFPNFGASGRAAWPLKDVPDVAHWVIARCSDCGLGFPDPMPAESELTSFYDTQTEPNDFEREFFVDIGAHGEAIWSDLAERLTRLNGGPGRLLEVGPAAGHLLRGAHEHGWTVVGVEASPKFAAIGRDAEWHVHEGTLATYEPVDGLFDLIVMTDVLEHLYDPVADLTRCAELLRPGGLLVIATCDIDSVAARYYGLRWRQIVISHTFYWTHKSISLALARSGFEVERISSVRYWDPDRRRETRRRVVESAKFAVRKVLQLTWMPLARRSSALRSASLDRKVGDQAVMADVMLVVGRRAGATTS